MDLMTGGRLAGLSWRRWLDSRHGRCSALPPSAAPTHADRDQTDSRAHLPDRQLSPGPAFTTSTRDERPAVTPAQSGEAPRPAPRYEIVKRALDLSLALASLTILAIPMLVVALVIRNRMGSPVIYRAVRAGRDGRPFVVYKFRSMLDLRDESGRPLPDEERITPLGRFLRRTSLDEFPQLINVIRGEMSLVGPRPLLVEYLERYSPEQARRLEVRPGITGWAQINGRNSLSWEERFELDRWYVNHRSLTLDLKILALTVLRVLKRESVDSEGDLSVPRFMGNGGP